MMKKIIVVSIVCIAVWGCSNPSNKSTSNKEEKAINKTQAPSIKKTCTYVSDTTTQEQINLYAASSSEPVSKYEKINQFPYELFFEKDVNTLSDEEKQQFAHSFFEGEEEAFEATDVQFKENYLLTTVVVSESGLDELKTFYKKSTLDEFVEEYESIGYTCE